MKLLAFIILFITVFACAHTKKQPEDPPCPTTNLPAWTNPGQMTTSEVAAYQEAKSKCEATNACLVTFTKVADKFVLQCVPRKK